MLQPAASRWQKYCVEQRQTLRCHKMIGSVATKWKEYCCKQMSQNDKIICHQAVKVLFRTDAKNYCHKVAEIRCHEMAEILLGTEVNLSLPRGGKIWLKQCGKKIIVNRSMANFRCHQKGKCASTTCRSYYVRKCKIFVANRS